MMSADTGLTKILLDDLYRVHGSRLIRLLLKEVFLGESFKYIFWFRVCQYLKRNDGLIKILYPFSALFLRHYKYKLGISIPLSVQIAEGLYIGHFGGVILNEGVRIGKNCNLSHQCTIGQTNRGDKIGVPEIGNEVFIGPGAVVIGKISIGDNVLIGANSLVIDNVPAGAVVAGNPAKVISMEGSEGYVNCLV